MRGRSVILVLLACLIWLLPASTLTESPHSIMLQGHAPIPSGNLTVIDTATGRILYSSMVGLTENLVRSLLTNASAHPSYQYILDMGMARIPLHDQRPLVFSGGRVMLMNGILYFPVEIVNSSFIELEGNGWLGFKNMAIGGNYSGSSAFFDFEEPGTLFFNGYISAVTRNHTVLKLINGRAGFNASFDAYILIHASSNTSFIVNGSNGRLNLSDTNILVEETTGGPVRLVVANAMIVPGRIPVTYKVKEGGNLSFNVEARIPLESHGTKISSIHLNGSGRYFFIQPETLPNGTVKVRIGLAGSLALEAHFNGETRHWFTIEEGGCVVESNSSSTSIVGLAECTGRISFFDLLFQALHPHTFTSTTTTSSTTTITSTTTTTSLIPPTTTGGKTRLPTATPGQGDQELVLLASIVVGLFTLMGGLMIFYYFRRVNR